MVCAHVNAPYAVVQCMSVWLVSVTFVYCVETAKDRPQLLWNANKKPYPRFRIVPFQLSDH